MNKHFYLCHPLVLSSPIIHTICPTSFCHSCPLSLALHSSILMQRSLHGMSYSSNFSLTPLWSIGPLRSIATRLTSYYRNLYPSHSHCFSFCQKCSGPSPSQSSFCLVLVGSKLKLIFLWQWNPSSSYVKSTSISAVWFAPPVSLVHSSTFLHSRKCFTKISKRFS